MPNLYADMASVRPPRIFWPLLGLGIVVAVYGVVTLVVRFFLHINDSFDIFYLVGPLAALLAGLPAWWLFVGKPRHATFPRGILVGAISSIIAHPVIGIIFALLEGDLSPSRLFPLVLSITIFSLITTGWVTLPFGCVIGFLLIYFQRALTHACQARTRGGSISW